MKLYEDGSAPNCRRVRIFLAEKKLDIPAVRVDLASGAHKSSAFAAINPAGKLPVLITDSGFPISESVIICQYLEDLHPHPSLFGRNALERAEIRMWSRMMEFELFLPVAHIIRHDDEAGNALCGTRIGEWARMNREYAERGLAILEERLSETAFVGGIRFSIADITSVVAIDMMKAAGLGIGAQQGSLRRWYDGVRKRESYAA